jgi:hypothetical protein
MSTNDCNMPSTADQAMSTTIYTSAYMHPGMSTVQVPTTLFISLPTCSKLAFTAQMACGPAWSGFSSPIGEGGSGISGTT